jgi:peptide/nickel transport system permease protein
MDTIKYLLTHSRLRLTGLFILSLFLALAIFAPLIAPHDPWETRKPYQPPSQEHYLGTNDIGQDILSELIYASRVSLTIGFMASLISVFIGATLGMLDACRQIWLGDDHRLQAFKMHFIA